MNPIGISHNTALRPTREKVWLVTESALAFHKFIQKLQFKYI